jgi:hypothetical protein
MSAPFSVVVVGLRLKPPGVDAIQRRRSVQAHERVGVVPVAAWTVTPVHHHHVGIAGSDECVDERHTRGACADDQVIGLDCAHSRLPDPYTHDRS